MNFYFSIRYSRGRTVLRTAFNVTMLLLLALAALALVISIWR